MKKPLPRCVALDRKGAQCARRVSDGSNPPICHVHRPGASSALTAPVERTPLEVIQKLMADRDPAIRLRAANAYLDQLAKDAKGCPKCERRISDDEVREDMLSRATAQDRHDLSRLIAQVNELTARIATQPALELDSLAPLRGDTPAPEVESAAQAVSSPRVVEVIARSESTRTILRESQYEAAGLIKLDNGAWTHAQGDEYAERIISGEIPFEEARAANDASRRHVDHMTAPESIWHAQEGGRRPYSD